MGVIVSYPAPRAWIEEDCHVCERWTAERGMASEWAASTKQLARRTLRVIALPGCPFDQVGLD